MNVLHFYPFEKHLRNVHIIHKAIPSTVLGPQAHIPNPANPVDQALDPPGTQQGSVAAAVSVAVAVPAVAVPAVAHPIETPDNGVAVSMNSLFYIMEPELIDD
ncbi:hypothetical protein BX616_001505 [Lobosporangium transversale]|nr:hypothetical protein BX616_001505 [Lobosporangium transversale]